jgi:hypothetical protein
MTNEEFKKKVKEFYQRNKYFHLIDVVAASPEHHECQVCGNRHLKKLCLIRNEERGEEWFVGWDCHSALDELQEREQKKLFKEMVKCSECGREQVRGELPREAYAAKLCNACWRKKNNISSPFGEAYEEASKSISWFFEPIGVEK